MPALGMITPSSNTCLEPVTYRLVAGTGITAHFARVPVTRIALEPGAAAGFAPRAMAEAAGLLAAAGVDVIAWNGTAGSWLGVRHDREIVATIEATTGIPATTSTLGILAACRAYGVTEIGLVVPYTADVTQRIVAEYAAAGITCVAVEQAGLADNRAFAQIPPARIAAQIRRVAVPSAQAVAVVCTNVHGAELVPVLEPEVGVPIFDSVAVTLWHALELIGGPVLPGQGSLLARHRPA